MRYCRVLARPKEIPREQQETAVAVYVAALAEVGHNPEPVWCEEPHWHVNTRVVPEPENSRARALGCTAAGIPFEWVESDS